MRMRIRVRLDPRGVDDVELFWVWEKDFCFNYPLGIGNMDVVVMLCYGNLYEYLYLYTRI